AIDFSAQAVRLDGEPLELTAYEYRLLEYLVRQRERVVTKSELSDYLYPHGEDRDSNVLEVLIGRLRRKLDPQGTLAPIGTSRGSRCRSRACTPASTTCSATSCGARPPAWAPTRPSGAKASARANGKAKTSIPGRTVTWP